MSFTDKCKKHIAELQAKETLANGSLNVGWPGKYWLGNNVLILIIQKKNFYLIVKMKY